MTLEERFGRKLRELRKHRRLTQARLGQMAGIPQTTISNWEVGVSEPRWHEVVRLSDLLDVPLDEFVTLTRSEESSLTTPSTERPLMEAYNPGPLAQPA